MAFPVKERVEGVSFKTLEYEVGQTESGNDYKRLSMTLKKGKNTINNRLYPIDPTMDWYDGDEEAAKRDVANLVRQINQILVALWGKEGAIEINTEAKQNAAVHGDLFSEICELMSSKFKKEKKYQIDNLVVKVVSDKDGKYARIPKYGRWLINPEETPGAELDPYTEWEERVVALYNEKRRSSDRIDSKPTEEISDEMFMGYTVNTGSTATQNGSTETKTEKSTLEQEVSEDDLPF